MDLVIHKMVKFHHVNIPNRRLLLKRLTRPTIAKPCLHVMWDLHKQLINRWNLFLAFNFLNPTLYMLICLARNFTNLLLSCTVKHRCNTAKSKNLRRPAEMRLKYLANIHSARHSKRIQTYINRPTVLKKRHVLFRHNLCNNAFVAVTTGHFVPYR